MVFIPAPPPASNGANLLPDGTTARWDQKIQTMNIYKLIEPYWGGASKYIFYCPFAEAGVRQKYGDQWPYRQTNAYVQNYMLFYNAAGQSNKSDQISRYHRMRRVGQRWKSLRGNQVKNKYFNILVGDAMFRPAYGTGLLKNIPAWDLIVNHRPYGKSLNDTFYSFSNGYGVGYAAYTLLGGANANYLFDDGSCRLYSDLIKGVNLDGPSTAMVPVEAALER